MPDLKTNFAVNLPLKLCRATIANAATRIVKSLCTLFHADHILAKFEPSRVVQNVQNFEVWEKKTKFFKTIFDKELTPFCKDVFEAATIFCW